MRSVLDLFSGFGGMTIGLQSTGKFKTTQFCEIDKFCQKVLRKNFPKVPIHDDVTTFEPEQSFDMVTAGFPCQDLSFAGKGAGLAGKNSGLFWHVLRTVCMVGQPRILLENVSALLNRGISTVLGSLAEVGYDTEWHCIPARFVGAPHGRDRIWIIADPQRDKQSREKPRCWTIGRMGRQQQSFPWDASWESALSKFRRVDDGLPRSVASTDGYRNAVVPQVVEVLGRAILETA